MNALFNTYRRTILFAADAAQAAAPAAAGTEEKPKFVWDGNKEYFTAADIAAGKMQERIDLITGNPHDGRMLYSAGYAQDWPANAGGAILPLAKNVKAAKEGDPASRKVYGVLIWPVWSLADFTAAEGGTDYVTACILNAQAAAILNPLRRQNIEAEAGLSFDALPVMVTQHIEGMADAERGTVKAYMEAAKVFLPNLKKQHLLFSQLTAPVLRLYLSNAQAAREFSAKLEERGGFLRIIDELEKITKSQGGNTEIYATWRETRDQAKEMEDIGDLDLDALSLPATTVPAGTTQPAA